MANACCFSRCQAPAQACLRPGIWLPGVRNLHMTTETWTLNANTQTSFDAVISAIDSVAEEENLLIKKQDRERLFLEVWSFTPHCNWLDVVDITFRQDMSSSEVTIAEARSFSTGLCPACCPLSFIFNCMFFWVPFSGNNFNDHRLEAIRNAITSVKAELTEHGPNCC